MAQQQQQENPGSGPSLTRDVSFSRLNAEAPAFVPLNHGPSRAHHYHQHHQKHHHHHHQQPAYYEYYGGAGFGEADPDPGLISAPAKEGLSDDVIPKITKQVEYYFSDLNLATTEHLMRFIAKDPDGYVPISIIGSFKKIKMLAQNNAFLSTALKTSTKLVVSEDGKKVRRETPFTELDVEELQMRIVVAENLPEDHCYQSLMKVFSVVGRVKNIRTCYPQTANGTNSATNRSSKLDMLFNNKLHAFVEYETAEDAERAVTELNDEGNWRSGLRVRLLHSCLVQPKHAHAGRGKKTGHEGDAEEEDDITTNQTSGKNMEVPSSITEASVENIQGEDNMNDKEGGMPKWGKGRGRAGGRGRGRGQYHHNNNNNNHHNYRSNHPVGTPPSTTHDPPILTKQPPGPRMPDGTRGFTMGRGKTIPQTTTD